MSRPSVRSLLTCVLAVFAADVNSWGQAQAGHGHRRPGCCEQCGVACGAPRLVECTVKVPVTVAETQMQSKVITKVVDREETYTVFQRVPVTRKFVKEKCYLEDEVQTKTVTKTECHRVTNPVERTAHVKVPETEIRQEMVRKPICTEHGLLCVEVPCERAVTVLRDDIQTDSYCEQDVVFAKTTRDISYVVKVPKKQVVPCAEEVVYELVPVEKTRIVQACVPEIVKQPVEVNVCKTLTKKILCCQACAHKHR